MKADRRKRSVGELSIGSGLIEELESRTMFSGLTVSAPGSVVAGQVFKVTVAAPAAEAGKQVKLKLASGAGALGGKLKAPLVAVANSTLSEATFTVLLKKTSTVTLKAIEGPLNGVSGNVAVSAGAATRLQFVSVFPSTQRIIPAGVLGPVVVNIADKYGNRVTQSEAVLPVYSNGVGWTQTGTFHVGDLVEEMRGNATVASGVWLGTSGGNFFLQVTSGAFVSNGTIHNVTAPGGVVSGNANATVTTNSGANVTLSVFSTLNTGMLLKKPVQVFTATQTTTSGTTTFSNLTTSLGGSNATTFTRGYYRLELSAPLFKTQEMRVFVR